MKHRYDKQSFLAYINNPMSKESISVLYAANNIKFEKCELYGDFVLTLIDTIFETYLGDDCTDLDEQFNHFAWCWNETVNNFKKEGLLFESGKLYNYFLEFMFEVFYSYEEKPVDFTDKGVVRIWKDIFNYEKVKTNSEVDTLIEIYHIFDKSLKIV
jgi:hypothetical protein